MFWQAKRDFSDTKWMSERRSCERSICLARKVFVCVLRQQGDDVIHKSSLDGAIRRKQSKLLFLQNRKKTFVDFVLRESQKRTK